MEGKSGVIRSIIGDLHSSDSLRDQMEGESGVTPSIIDELHSWILKEINWKVKVVSLEV